MWCLGILYLSAVVSFGQTEGRRHRHRKGGSGEKRRSFIIERMSLQATPLTKTYAPCQHEGSIRHHGEAWSPSPCVPECKCIHGHVKCAKLDCPDLNCDNPIKKKWKCCPECPSESSKESKCGVEAVGGNTRSACCVFPFKYNDVKYYTCTYQDSSQPWCSASKDFDKDRKWGLCVDKGDVRKFLKSKTRKTKFGILTPQCEKDQNCQNKEEILNQDKMVAMQIEKLPLELAGLQSMDDNTTQPAVNSTGPVPTQNATTATPTTATPLQNATAVATTGAPLVQNATAPQNATAATSPTKAPGNTPTTATAVSNATTTVRPNVTITTPAITNVTVTTPVTNVTTTVPTMKPIVTQTITKPPLVVPGGGVAKPVGQGGAMVTGGAGGVVAGGKLINVTLQPYNRTANLSWPPHQIAIPIKFLPKPVPIWGTRPNSGSVPPYLKPAAHNATKPAPPAGSPDTTSNVIVETTEVFNSDSKSHSNNTGCVTGNSREPTVNTGNGEEVSGSSQPTSSPTAASSNQSTAVTQLPTTASNNQSNSSSLPTWAHGNQPASGALPTLPSNQSSSTSLPSAVNANNASVTPPVTQSVTQPVTGTQQPSEKVPEGEATAVGQNAATGEPVKPVSETQTVQPVQTGNTAQSNAATSEPVKPVSETQTVQPVQPGNTAKSNAATGKPVKPVSETQTVQPLQPGNTAQSNAATGEPVKPVSETQTVRPVQPGNTAKSNAATGEPVKPVSETQTVQPVQPGNTAQSSPATSEPVKPVSETQTVQPVQTGNTVQPNTATSETMKLVSETQTLQPAQTGTTAQSNVATGEPVKPVPETQTVQPVKPENTVQSNTATVEAMQPVSETQPVQPGSAAQSNAGQSQQPLVPGVEASELSPAQPQPAVAPASGESTGGGNAIKIQPATATNTNQAPTINSGTIPTSTQGNTTEVAPSTSQIGSSTQGSATAAASSSQLTPSKAGYTTVQPAAPVNNQQANSTEATVPVSQPQPVSATEVSQVNQTSEVPGNTNPNSTVTENSQYSANQATYSEGKTNSEPSEEEALKKLFANYRGPLSLDDLKALYAPGGIYSSYNTQRSETTGYARSQYTNPNQQMSSTGYARSQYTNPNQQMSSTGYARSQYTNPNQQMSSTGYTGSQYTNNAYQRSRQQYAAYQYPSNPRDPYAAYRG